MALTGTPNAAAIFAITASETRLVPSSIRAYLCLLTPIRAAASSCVKPRTFRKVLMRSPKSSSIFFLALAFLWKQSPFSARRGSPTATSICQTRSLANLPARHRLPLFLLPLFLLFCLLSFGMKPCSFGKTRQRSAAFSFFLLSFFPAFGSARTEADAREYGTVLFFSSAFFLLFSLCFSSPLFRCPPPDTAKAPAGRLVPSNRGFL